MTTARRIAVLLPPVEAGDNPDKLLAAAAALAQGGTLDVLALRQSGAAPLPPQNLACPTRWWDLSHPTLARLDADNLVPLFVEGHRQRGPQHARLAAASPGAVGRRMRCAPGELAARRIDGPLHGPCACRRGSGRHSPGLRRACGIATGQRGRLLPGNVAPRCARARHGAVGNAPSAPSRLVRNPAPGP